MKKGINHPETDVDIFEHPKGKSEVVPNQALNIRDIMLRSLRGAILPEVQNNQLEFGDDETHDDAFNPEIDLTDIEETAEKVSYLNQRIKQLQDAKAKPNHQDVEKSDSEELPSPSAE